MAFDCAPAVFLEGDNPVACDERDEGFLLGAVVLLPGFVRAKKPVSVPSAGAKLVEVAWEKAGVRSWILWWCSGGVLSSGLETWCCVVRAWHCRSLICMLPWGLGIGVLAVIGWRASFVTRGSVGDRAAYRDTRESSRGRTNPGAKAEDFWEGGRRTQLFQARSLARFVFVC